MRIMKCAVAAAALLAACDRGGSAGAAQQKPAAQVRADSAESEQKALRDSGVSVDTQTVDTGSAAAATPAEDN
jgi:hypothetical protein